MADFIDEDDYQQGGPSRSSYEYSDDDQDDGTGFYSVRGSDYDDRPSAPTRFGQRQRSTKKKHQQQAPASDDVDVVAELKAKKIMFKQPSAKASGRVKWDDSQIPDEFPASSSQGVDEAFGSLWRAMIGFCFSNLQYEAGVVLVSELLRAKLMDKKDSTKTLVDLCLMAKMKGVPEEVNECILAIVNEMKESDVFKVIANKKKEAINRGEGTPEDHVKVLQDIESFMQFKIKDVEDEEEIDEEADNLEEREVAKQLLELMAFYGRSTSSKRKRLLNSLINYGFALTRCSVKNLDSVKEFLTERYNEAMATMSNSHEILKITPTITYLTNIKIGLPASSTALGSLVVAFGMMLKHQDKYGQTSRMKICNFLYGQPFSYWGLSAINLLQTCSQKLGLTVNDMMSLLAIDCLRHSIQTFKTFWDEYIVNPNAPTFTVFAKFFNSGCFTEISIKNNLPMVHAMLHLAERKPADDEIKPNNSVWKLTIEPIEPMMENTFQNYGFIVRSQLSNFENSNKNLKTAFAAAKARQDLGREEGRRLYRLKEDVAENATQNEDETKQSGSGTSYAGGLAIPKKNKKAKSSTSFDDDFA